MSLDLASHLPTIITAGAGLLGMYATHRTARKNVKEQAEIEAYIRARTMDLQTITRQDEEIKDLLGDNIVLRKRDREQTKEIDRLRTERIALVKQNIKLQDQIRGIKDDEQGV